MTGNVAESPTACSVAPAAFSHWKLSVTFITPVEVSCATSTRLSGPATAEGTEPGMMYSAPPSSVVMLKPFPPANVDR